MLFDQHNPILPAMIRLTCVWWLVCTAFAVGASAMIEQRWLIWRGTWLGLQDTLQGAAAGVLLASMILVCDRYWRRDALRGREFDGARLSRGAFPAIGCPIPTIPTRTRALPSNLVSQMDTLTMTSAHKAIIDDIWQRLQLTSLPYFQHWPAGPSLVQHSLTVTEQLLQMTHPSTSNDSPIAGDPLLPILGLGHALGKLLAWQQQPEGMPVVRHKDDASISANIIARLPAIQAIPREERALLSCVIGHQHMPDKVPQVDRSDTRCRDLATALHAALQATLPTADHAEKPPAIDLTALLNQLGDCLSRLQQEDMLPDGVRQLDFGRIIELDWEILPALHLPGWGLATHSRLLQALNQQTAPEGWQLCVEGRASCLRYTQPATLQHAIGRLRNFAASVLQVSSPPPGVFVAAEQGLVGFDCNALAGLSVGEDWPVMAAMLQAYLRAGHPLQDLRIVQQGEREYLLWQQHANLGSTQCI